MDEGGKFLNDHTLAYEKKKEDYTKFWKDFKKPLENIYKELNNKNKLHAETNEILKQLVDVFKKQ